jgi:hypothetical protein
MGGERPDGGRTFGGGLVMRHVLRGEGVKSAIVRITAAGVVLGGCLAAAWVDAGLDSGPRWWKGNLHTHSLWSDGDQYPEMIAAWYKERGYNFLALSDHNILSEGEKWVDAGARGGLPALQKYEAAWGTAWVTRKSEGGKTMVRLKTLEEFRPRLEQPGSFLMVPSEEITDSFERKPVHMNATNIKELIKPQGGKTITEVMQNNVNAVMDQRKRTGQPMVLHLNHPNFGYAITAEQLAAVKGERFFEVYNGHPTVYNTGNGERAGTDRIWDIILALRLSTGTKEPMYGLAVDDSHHYHAFEARRSNPGRGWIMVRADRLAPESIVQALEQGEFYSTNGVRLKEVKRTKNRISVEVDGEAGVRYSIRFIGTRQGFEEGSRPVTGANGQEIATTRRYSDDVGETLSESWGTKASYTLKGDELYVRARIVSSRLQPTPNPEGGYETAWTQPLIPVRP